MVNPSSIVLDLSSGTIFFYQKLLEFNPAKLASYSLLRENTKFSLLKPTDKSNSSFCTFEIDRLAAHELFGTTLSCRDFSWSGVLSLISIYGLCFNSGNTAVNKVPYGMR
ncbi:hypothetical protein Tco_0281262 [Tanacetum coccineum]